MAALTDLLAFDVEQSAVSLWICRGPRGGATDDPAYTARWVGLTQDLETVLKATVNGHRSQIADVQPYDFLSAIPAGGAMTIDDDETHAGLLTAYLATQTQQKRVRNEGDLYNCTFYVIKLVHGDSIVYAVRKTDAVWQTKRSLSMRSVIFRENELTIANDPRFDIATNIDFYIVDDEILVCHMGHFETILRYKQAHQGDFAALQGEIAFQAVFDDIAPLIDHVGQNKIRLRRASAIRQKGHYRDQNFMTRLRQQAEQYGFTIQFHQNGTIIPTEETCAQIITALLDHRLSSAFSTQIYDVQGAVVIAS
ncbi:MAG: hypothetical protein ABS35_41890 [Kaistia sp. SCN 65-12]|nr:MAG: hypothetical protein ABS35_41890 [Kaistia sp. SCN 65-12]